MKKMADEKKRVLLIGEKPDADLLFCLGEEGYEVAALESPLRARDVYPSYKPHFIFARLRYPKDIAILEECLAFAGTVPVIAAISILAKTLLVKAVKEKADSFFRWTDELLDKFCGGWGHQRMKGNFLRLGKRIWELLRSRMLSLLGRAIFGTRKKRNYPGDSLRSR